ncbi:tetratricopeptide repeat protein [Ruegeria meonggei]|uniref:tetratricopeptide repeat protein n=1 Tax=Ruegeria meonggei TaxID=1446476 RepID=UPI00366C6D6E
MNSGTVSSQSDTGFPDQMIDALAVQQELEKVLDSEDLAGAARLQSFLRYVVDEALAGRGNAIRAKTIGEDVYGVFSNQGEDPLAIVRVDAGRLRRRLSAYYQRPENTNAIRIHIDKGGYAPRFETLPQKFEPSSPERVASIPVVARTKLWISLAAATTIVLIAAITLLTPFGHKDSITTGPDGASKLAERDALFAVSPAKLQAKNLAEDARNLMFPALDRQRLMASLALFEQVIALDPDYYAGFAGAAQINAMLASQMPDTPAREDYIAKAKERAERAVVLASGEPWSQSAMAMVYFAEKDCRTAATYSERATRLSPRDLYAQNFDALIALFCGEFDRAVQVAKPLIGTSELSERLIFRNVAATAEFHRGNFQDTIDIYNLAVNAGAPVGALTLTYLAAANAKLDQTQEATRYVSLLTESWPDFPLESFLSAVFIVPDHANPVIEALEKAGWQSTAGR